MDILLDTHILVWLSESSSKLTENTVRLLQDTQNSIHVSYFSLLEIKLKAIAGKLDFDISVLDDFTHLGIELIMPSIDHLRIFKIYDQSNKDPFDNLLIATAIDQKLMLLTNDQKILRLRKTGLKLIANE